MRSEIKLRHDATDSFFKEYNYIFKTNKSKLTFDEYMNYFEKKCDCLPTNFSHYYHFSKELHEKYADNYVLGWQPKQDKRPDLIWASLFQLSKDFHIVLMSATDLRQSNAYVYCTPVLWEFGGMGKIQEWTDENREFIFEDMYDDTPEKTGFFHK